MSDYEFVIRCYGERLGKVWDHTIRGFDVAPIVGDCVLFFPDDDDHKSMFRVKARILYQTLTEGRPVGELIVERVDREALKG